MNFKSESDLREFLEDLDCPRHLAKNYDDAKKIISAAICRKGILSGKNIVPRPSKQVKMTYKLETVRYKSACVYNAGENDGKKFTNEVYLYAIISIGIDTVKEISGFVCNTEKNHHEKNLDSWFIILFGNIINYDLQKDMEQYGK
jgi:hypothetical protein